MFQLCVVSLDIIYDMHQENQYLMEVNFPDNLLT